MSEIDATFIMLTPARDASVVSQEPSHDGQTGRVVIGHDLILWLYPAVAENLKKAIDEAMAQLPSVVVQS